MDSNETRVKLDTGAELNVISVELYKQITNVALRKSNACPTFNE